MVPIIFIPNQSFDTILKMLFELMSEGYSTCGISLPLCPCLESECAWSFIERDRKCYLNQLIREFFDTVRENHMPP